MAVRPVSRPLQPSVGVDGPQASHPRPQPRL